ncbi:DNA excision repair protein ERCC-1-like isoform X2 [Nematostella vectensis]|uniref:DNA excision repair protein ERCC-1-like isoform X2 n=1 Tax=Nematostella vectensis TaxID=45351 RepID=UPI002076F260|nr:DNA excision repair protein ERCC-1-like isoform X2 [Nematostella vectensis]
MADGRKRFAVPNPDEIEAKNTANKISKTAFAIYKTSTANEEQVEKDQSSVTKSALDKQEVDFDARKRLLRALQIRKSQLTKELSADQDSLPVTSDSLRATTASMTTSTSGLNSVSNESISAPEIPTGNEKTRENYKRSDASSSNGKSFKESFAFLKQTKHYEEAEAQMKAIESAKPTVANTIIPAKPKPNTILVNPRQKGNPVLKFVRCVPWEYSDIVPDYVLGSTTCALFLSLRYHHFNPNYIHERLAQLGSCYELRILLVLVDVKDPHQTIRELNKMAIMADCTLMMAWSSEEAGRYLETYKVYENKPVDALQGQTDGDYLTRLQDCLTTVKGVNKTDVITASSTFGSLSDIANTPKDDLAFLPGFGPLKMNLRKRNPKGGKSRLLIG